jgi:hypothetical protein
VSVRTFVFNDAYSKNTHKTRAHVHSSTWYLRIPTLICEHKQTRVRIHIQTCTRRKRTLPYRDVREREEREQEGRREGTKGGREEGRERGKQGWGARVSAEREGEGQ